MPAGPPVPSGQASERLKPATLRAPDGRLVDRQMIRSDRMGGSRFHDRHML